MMFFFLCVFAVGVQVSATTPNKPPPECKCPDVPPDCGPNAYFDVCSYPCPPQNCSTLWTKYSCKKESCKPGCRCKDGFLRDDKTGRCIDKDECYPTCPPGEKYDKCYAHCQDTCENYNVTHRPCPHQCHPGCVCDTGTVRRKDGQCVPPHKCKAPPVCGENEKYLECGTACPLTCDNYKTPPPCLDICVAGCFCIDGYVRDRNNRCVKREDCDPTCPPGEKYDKCYAHCQDTCENYNVTHRPCPHQCHPGCVCDKGTVRRKDGQCVPPHKCKAPPVCGENEKYLECGTACPLTCDNYKTPPPCIEICVAGCFCIDGYVRDRNNRCIKREDCDTTCPPGEKYDKCYAHCQDTCENYNVTHRPCPHQCHPGCVCDKGTVRKKDGQCVPPHKCTDPTCPVDEVYDRCSAHCEPTCENHDPNRPCTKICKPGCKCRDPLVRRKDGKCVKLNQCNTTCPPGEKYDKCYAHCQDTCENYNVTHRPCPHQCHPGCVCDKGTVRRKDGQCVPPCECKAPPVCGENEKYLECGTACPLTCDNYKTPPPCVDICVAGCFCIDGYVRDRNNRCIKREDCVTTCPPGEKYDKCYAHCQDTCENYNVTHRPCPHQCHPGCVCDKGTVRRKDGQCVPPCECTPPRCNANETYTECGSACPPTCDTRGNTCIVCTQQCVKGCFCNKGLVRAKDGRCIAPEHCPPRCCKDPNEEFDECPPPCPPGDDCSNMWTKYDCSQFPDCCKPQCRCKSGYLRKDGKCVPTEQCTSSG